MRYFGKAVEETGNDEALIREGRRELLLTVASTPADTRGVVESVAASENVPLDALYGMLKVLGVDTSAGAAGLDKQLRDGAERVKQFMTEASGTAKSDAELIRLSELADRAQAEGAMDVALMFRERASARADELSAARDVLEEQLREDRLEIAETYAEHGATAALVFDFRTAEEKFKDAFEEVDGWDDEKALEYKAVLASTRYWRGEKEGSVELMQGAVADYEAALKYVSREGRPGEWAVIHRGIATAQTALAEWSGDPAQFEAAIAAYREVLAVLPPEQRVQRAITLSNLGLAYQSLAYRRIGTAELDLSLGALLEAKKIIPDGETIRLLQNSIGLTLGMIGFRERDEEKLRRAAAILEATIANDLDHPFDIAKAQTNLGLVLTELGSLTNEPAVLQRAVDVLRQALEVQKRDTAPQDWASVEFNLGLALTNLGKISRDETKLGEAIAAFDLALEHFERSRAPLLWAMAMRDRADAYFELSQLSGLKEPASIANDGYELALQELDRIRAPGEWSKTQTARFVALAWLGQAKPDTQLVIDALEVGAEIETILTPEASPLDWATIKRHLGDLNLFLFHFEDRSSRLEAAAAAYRDGAAVAPVDRDPVLWLRLHHSLAETLGEIAARAGDPAGMDEAYEIALGAFSRGVLLERSELQGDNVVWDLGQLMTTLDNARLLLNEAATTAGVQN
jgi:tetratricopeptide (TPR) repeat protein